MNYEQELLNDIDPDFEVLAKCVDNHNPRLDYKLIRGYGGVCIFWRKSLNSSIKISSQGNDRTIIAEIATENKPICLINVYMPSTSKNSDEEYKEMLIELEECLEIYKDSHEVILCGGMNASMRRATGRDHLLHNFIKETNNDRKTVRS
ncbi:hypothetical protein DPMN_042552 [Dreissena polymorpha]|uniref:Endonuclease/exonuclease/phosphatase domain-containing protein n=1 Tax=Dreissena polymorpha TaxID=45954 RepID=A0A9D4CZA9_DREPO|nr:hypothetical protein DPMN_042552 [Dreissena polymorpha]